MGLFFDTLIEGGLLGGAGRRRGGGDGRKVGWQAGRRQ